MILKSFFHELGYLYTLFRLGYRETQRKKSTPPREFRPAAEVSPVSLYQPGSVIPAPAPHLAIKVYEEPAPVRPSVRPSTCGLCTSWSPLERDRNARHRMGNYNGICLEYNRVVHRDNTICFDEQKSEKLKVKPPRPMPPEAAPVVREEKPIVAMSDEELERRLKAKDMLRLIADDEDANYDDEREACRVIRQNDYKPRGYVSKLTDPKNKEMKDLFDHEAHHDSTLNLRENNWIKKNIWRAETYA